MPVNSERRSDVTSMPSRLARRLARFGRRRDHGGMAVMCAVMVPVLVGFGTKVGRRGDILLSDEEVQLAWRLQDAGHSAHYDSRIVVYHHIQRVRLTPAWLLSRLYWQGVSTVISRRLLGHPGAVWRELPRRLLVALTCAPATLCRRDSPDWIAWRWRFAYARGHR